MFTLAVIRILIKLVLNMGMVKKITNTMEQLFLQMNSLETINDEIIPRSFQGHGPKLPEYYLWLEGGRKNKIRH